MLSFQSGRRGKWRGRVGDPGGRRRHQHHVPTVGHHRALRRGLWTRAGGVGLL